jgi:hypothetical protein
MVRDGLEVVEYVLGTLAPASGRVVLVGHSWGSALGVHMLKRRPELFSAYVGTGQLVNMRENEEYNYRWTLRRAELMGNTEAVDAVRALGAPPFSDPVKLKALREWSDRFAQGDGDPLIPRPPVRPANFGPDDVPPMVAGAEFSLRQLLPELFKVDLPALGLEFEVPMFFFHGACDHHTPAELAERYCSSISAPHKEFGAVRGVSPLRGDEPARGFLAGAGGAGFASRLGTGAFSGDSDSRAGPPRLPLFATNHHRADGFASRPSLALAFKWHPGRNDKFRFQTAKEDATHEHDQQKASGGRVGIDPGGHFGGGSAGVRTG